MKTTLSRYLRKVNHPLTLQYATKPKQTLDNCIPNWYEHKFRGYEDDCEIENPLMECFEGRYFKFYENKFESLSANVNFNSWVGYGSAISPPTEIDFIERLEKVFRCGKYINGYAESVSHIKTVSETFENILYHIKSQCKFHFQYRLYFKGISPRMGCKRERYNRIYK